MVRSVVILLVFVGFAVAQEAKPKKPALGQLSEKYESGGKGPGTVSSGKGDPGGVSYGTYQFASKLGRADEFVKKYYPTEFKDLKGGSDEFTKVWQKLAKDDPAALHRNEHEFIKATHYDPQAKKLLKDVSLDIEDRSAALKDVVWSTAVQHGPNTGLIAKVVKELTKETKLADVTDEAIIKAIYAERGRKDDEGKLVYFKKVSKDWIKPLSDRFISECADALQLLKKK